MNARQCCVVSVIGLIAAYGLLAAAAPPADKGSKAEPAPVKAEGAEKGAEKGKELQVGVMADGRPVAGATVWLVQRDDYAPRVDEATSVAQTALTDARGSCRVSLPRKLVADPRWRDLWIVVHKPGRALNAAAFQQSDVPQQLRAELPPDATTYLTVVGPEGRPVPDATLEIGGVFADQTSTPLPDETKAMLTAQTDSAGKVAIRGVARGQVHELTIRSQRYGQRHLTFSDKARLADRVVLPAVGEVQGQVTCEDPKQIAGLLVTIFSYRFDAAPTKPHGYGYAEVRTDAAGRFRAPAIGEGKLILNVWEGADIPYRSRQLDGHAVHAGKTTTVEVPLRPAVLCRGIVREAGSGKPLPGVGVRASVSLRSVAGPDKIVAVSDAEGRYQFYSLPGIVRLFLSAPAPHLTTSNPRGTRIPADGREFDVPPVELVRGLPLRGQMLDPDGKPVAAATIQVAWSDETGAGHWHLATPDEAGNFEFPSVHPAQSLSVAAFVNHNSVIGITTTADAKQPLIVRVPKLEFIALRGRVVDEEGKPAPGIDYEIRQSGPAIDNVVWYLKPFVDRAKNGVSHTMTFVGRTQADGTFETPRQFVPSAPYQVRVVVRRALIAESASIVPAQAGTTKFPDLVFRRSRVPKEREYRFLTLRGQAVDSQDRAVKGAKVIGWYNAERLLTKTNGEGHFRFGGVPDYGGFVFIDAPGYRFFGQYVRPEGKAATFKLIADSEPAPAWETLPNWLRSSEQLADERKLIALHGDKAYRSYERMDDKWRRATQDYDLLRALELVASADPVRALELLRKGDVKRPGLGDFIRHRAGVAMMASDPDEAKATLSAIESAVGRSRGYRAAAETLGRKERELKLALLAEALVHARAVREADNRAIALSDVGTSLIDIGQTEQGAKLVREAGDLARELGTRAWPAYARGHVAKRLGPLDPAGALRLVGAIEDASEFDRHHRGLAIALSARHPEAAQRALNKIRDAQRRESAIPGMCYYLASIDLDRAKRLAAAADAPLTRAHALGKTAEGLADTQPAVAKQLLHEAFDILTQAAEGQAESSDGPVSPLGLAAGLLPAVEAVDPSLVPEYAWRALALRKNVAAGREPRVLGRHGEEGRMRMADPVLAACLSRYNAELARLLLQPPGDEGLDSTDRYPFPYPGFYFAALTILDPEEAIRTAAKMPDLPNTTKGDAWQEVLGMLSRTPRQRWEFIQERNFGVWSPDREE